jgi:hypothetical protein
MLSAAGSEPVSLGGRGRAHAACWRAVARKLNPLRWGRQLIIMGGKERAGIGVSCASLVAAAPGAHLASAGRADFNAAV